MLEAMAPQAFASYRYEIDSLATDEKGLVLWGELELDVTVNQLTKRRCAVCGAPARVSVYDLRRRTRLLRCGACPPPVSRGREAW